MSNEVSIINPPFVSPPDIWKSERGSDFTLRSETRSSDKPSESKRVTRKSRVYLACVQPTWNDITFCQPINPASPGDTIAFITRKTTWPAPRGVKAALFPRVFYRIRPRDLNSLNKSSFEFCEGSMPRHHAFLEIILLRSYRRRTVSFQWFQCWNTFYRFEGFFSSIFQKIPK